MRGVPGNRQKAHGMGLSVEQVGENPTAITLFPVDFSDTGNFGREGLAKDWLHRQLHELGYDRAKF